MTHGLKELAFLSALALVIVAVGCSGDEGAGTTTGNTSSGTSGGGSHSEEHAHPSEGPHHGALIEFGNEEYHGEFLHDAESITIYILDSGATNAVPIDAESITLNVTRDGEASQHTLVATPDEGDPEGQSSRFVLADAAVVEMLDTEGTTARISVTIGDTPYQANLAHDHEGHDHAHSHE